MRRLNAFFLFMLLSIGNAFAQSAYEFTTPQGWQQTNADGIVVLKANDNTQHSMVVMLFPVVPMNGSIDTLFDAYRTSVEHNFQFQPTKVTEKVRGQANGAENVMLAGIYSTSNGPRTVVFFGRAENGAFGMGMFVTTNVDNIAANVQQLSVLFNTLHLSSNAAQIAAANAQQVQPPSQTNQQQTQSSPPLMPENSQEPASKPTLEELIQKNNYGSW